MISRFKTFYILILMFFASPIFSADQKVDEMATGYYDFSFIEVFDLGDGCLNSELKNFINLGKIVQNEEAAKLIYDLLKMLDDDLANPNNINLNQRFASMTIKVINRLINDQPNSYRASLIPKAKHCLVKNHYKLLLSLDCFNGEVAAFHTERNIEKIKRLILDYESRQSNGKNAEGFKKAWTLFHDLDPTKPFDYDATVKKIHSFLDIKIVK